MPVDEAETLHLLPAMPEEQKHISVVGHANGSNSDLPVCQSSLTFVMETSEAGFGNTLLALWLSYGVARKEGRTFFIDDSNWYVVADMETSDMLTFFQVIRKIHYILQAASQILMLTSTGQSGSSLSP
jgi:hypothetical protein